MTKVCSKCGTEKDFLEFSNRKSAKDGKKSACKECLKKQNKEYNERNKEKIKAYHKKRYIENKHEINKRNNEYYNNNKEKKAEYYEKNKDHINSQKKEYRKNNPEKIKGQKKISYQKNKKTTNKRNNEYYSKNKDIINAKRRSKYDPKKHNAKAKEYRDANKEKIAKLQKIYYEANKAELKEKQKIWYNKNKKTVYQKQKTKRQSNPEFKLRCNMATLFSTNIRTYGNKKTKPFFKYTGIPYSEYIKYLKKDKLWCNFGLHSGIHVDHIIPCAAYDFTDEEEIKKCWDPKNLRLLDGIENFSKSKKIDYNLIKKYNIEHLLPERLTT